MCTFYNKLVFRFKEKENTLCQSQRQRQRQWTLSSKQLVEVMGSFKDIITYTSRR